MIKKKKKQKLMHNFYLINPRGTKRGPYTAKQPADAAKKAVTKYPYMKTYRIFKENEENRIFVYHGEKKKLPMSERNAFTKKHNITHVPVVKRIGIEHK